MSRIVVTVQSSNEKANVVKQVRKLTKLSSANLYKAIEDGSPLIDLDIPSFNEHELEDIFIQLQEIQQDDKSEFLIYELISRDDFSKLTDRDKMLRLVDPERLRNLFDSYMTLAKEIY